jgi:hypothetical protein
MRFFLLSMVLVWGCGDDATGTDAGRGVDGGGRDGGGRDGGGTDGGGTDGGGTDSGAVDSGGPADAGAAIDASTCEGIEAQATAFLNANKTCSTAADCMQVAAGCYTMQEDCCVVYMNTSHDTARWSEYLDALGTCAGGACGCCAAIPAPPDCIDGRCLPARR